MFISDAICCVYNLNDLSLFFSVLSHTGGTPLTPSARISALNIVGDLLRKVGVSTKGKTP